MIKSVDFEKKDKQKTLYRVRVMYMGEAHPETFRDVSTLGYSDMDPNFMMLYKAESDPLGDIPHAFINLSRTLWVTVNAQEDEELHETY